MSKYVIEDTSLIAIGDAIREKGGTTATMSPAQMAEAILALTIGGGDEPGGGGGTAEPGAITKATIEGSYLTTLSNLFDVSAYYDVDYICFFNYRNNAHGYVWRGATHTSETFTGCYNPLSISTANTTYASGSISSTNYKLTLKADNMNYVPELIYIYTAAAGGGGGTGEDIPSAEEVYY
jgi:hypothetical protein